MAGRHGSRACTGRITSMAREQRAVTVGRQLALFIYFLLRPSPQPMGNAADTQSGSSLFVTPFWKHPQIYPEMCFHGDSKSFQVDNKN